MNNIITDKSQQQAAIVRLTGLTYIIIIVIGVLNSIFIDSRLIVYEDITLTINNILSNEFLFRFGSASVLILYLFNDFTFGATLFDS